MKELSNPDDKLFKAVFQRPDLVKDLLLQRAAPEFLSKLDLDSLQLTNASYVDEDLAEHLADIVHSCRTQRGKTVEISLLLEHKSYIPPNPPFQVMRYQMKGWTIQMAQPKGTKTPIIPVIFYHGTEKWEVRNWGSYLEGMEPEFEWYTPAGHYLFIDLSKMTDEEISRFRSGFLVTALFLMKHRLERDYLLKNLRRIVIFVEKESNAGDGDISDELLTIYRYLKSLRSITWGEIKKRVESLPKSKKAMTVLEEIRLEFREEAREEAREQGREQGREQAYLETSTLVIQSLIEHFPDFTDEQIAKVSNLPLEMVKKVRHQKKEKTGRPAKPQRKTSSRKSKNTPGKNGK